MGRYTMSIMEVIQNKYDLGLKDYPIYDEKHREELNQKIVNHYLTREIGYETPNLFIMKLNIKMNEIMPYYNQLYKSESIEFNPLYNIEIHETYTQNSENESETGSIGKFADTPQSKVTDYDLKNNTFITNATVENGKGKSKDKNSYTKTTEGSSAGLPFSKAIKQWREIMINIDMMIIEELSDLFINIY